MPHLVATDDPREHTALGSFHGLAELNVGGHFLNRCPFLGGRKGGWTGQIHPGCAEPVAHLLDRLAQGAPHLPQRHTQEHHQAHDGQSYEDQHRSRRAQGRYQKLAQAIAHIASAPAIGRYNARVVATGHHM